jgi:hypothetical protein
VVFSDGAFENAVATWGFFLVDTADNSRFVAGGQVPQHLVQFWISTVGEQIITQVELFAVLAARQFLGARCLGRKLLYFIDNDPARDSLIRGWSQSDASLSVIFEFYKHERASPSYIWFARVPSFSNIADEPSRVMVVQVAKLFHAQYVEASLCADTVATLIKFESRPMTFSAGTTCLG